jgi:xylulokinase
VGEQLVSSGTPLLLGLDVGTSGGRAVLFDADGRVVAQASQAWSPRFPRPDWAELDAEALWTATARLVCGACDRARPGRVVGVGVSSQLTTLFLDGGHTPVFPVLPWLDRRAEAEARALEAEAGREQLAAVAGRRAAAERPAAIVRWLRCHEPTAWERIAWVCTLKDYLVYRLTGRLVSDEPHASYSLLFDVRAKRWDPGLCGMAGLSASRLPEVVSSASVIGRVHAAAAQATGLPVGAPVVAGGPDGTLAALGAGLTMPAVGVDVTGTTDVVFACLREPKLDPGGGLVTNVHACPGRWLLGGPTTTTGGMLAWFAEQIAKEIDFGRLTEEAAAIPAGAEGVRCFPTLSGDRTPVWDPHLRAAFLGLGMAHRRGHCVRAILEACACVVRRVQQAIVGFGERMQEMRVVGGAVESPLWSQIRADMLGLPVRPMPVRNASSLGAAILAAAGAGVHADVVTAAARMSGGGELLEPQPAVRGAYDRVYADFERMQALLQAFGRTA